MGEPLEIFWWTVPRDGYRWVEVDGRLYLTEGRPAGVAFMARHYQPLESEPALFMKFADVKPAAENILAFANAFGRLGVNSVLPVEHQGRKSLGAGEPLWLWEQEIEAMRRVTELWRAVRDGNVGLMKERIRATREHAAYDDGRSMAVIYSRPHDLRPELSQFVEEEDLLRPAMFYVQQEVNRRLEEHTSPRILYIREEDRLEMRVVPKNLLGALWLQFARAVDGNRDFRRCRQCGQWFAVSPSERTSREFCSNACRSKAYRERIEKALRMHAEGKPIGLIALELESDERTVVKWIEKGVQRRGQANQGER